MPVIPFIPAIIGAAGAVGGGLLAGKKSGSQQSAEQAQAAALQQQTQNSADAAAQGKQYNSMAQPALTNALNYWQTLLNGDRTAMSTALGPEIQQIGAGNQQAFQNLSQYAPRGGARASSLASIPFNNAAQVSNLYATLRPQAAAQVDAIGSDLANKGLAGLGTSIQGDNGAANSYLNAAILAMQQKQNAIGTGAQIGKGLYTWAKGQDWSKIFGGGGSGNSGNNGATNDGPPLILN